MIMQYIKTHKFVTKKLQLVANSDKNVYKYIILFYATLGSFWTQYSVNSILGVLNKKILLNSSLIQNHKNDVHIARDNILKDIPIPSRGYADSPPASKRAIFLFGQKWHAMFWIEWKIDF